MAWIGMNERDGLAGVGGANRPAPASTAADRHPAPIVPDERPTLLIAGHAAAAAELAAWGERAGLRCVGTVGLDGIAARLALMVAVDLILVDLRGAALDSPNGRALAQRHGLAGARLAVITDLAGLDSAMARLDGPATDYLCDPAPGDIVSLLVMTALEIERQGQGPVLHDNARDGESIRIEQLSEEVRRLARTIDRLTHGNGASPGEAMMEPPSPYRTMAGDGAGTIEPIVAAPIRNTPAGAPSHAEIRALLRARRLRDQYLPTGLFADPAWDMILDLMAARLSGQRVSVSSLCIAAAVPPTTALRWIRQLTERGVFARIDDPADGRRVFIELTDDATEAVMAWTLAVRRNGGLLTPGAPG